ncbi:gem-associated protein 5 isoform X2 [Amblyraja radiata]|uniref:gem-associated protein 5 isoform X2 n=1 Tax=Amblyraja radiata TaxID=386614 RepID=UPI001401CBEB|nr:gem-associated protein 5 isoform X2 [Amblyraja radiata]
MSDRLLPPSPNWYLGRCSDAAPAAAAAHLGFGAKNSVFLLDVTRGRPQILGELRGHTERVTGFSFCPHAGHTNTCASSSDDGTVKIWDTDTKAVLKEHTAHLATITALHWSPLRKDLVVSGDEKGVVVCWWHFKDETQSWFPEPRHIFCLSCSPHREEHVALGYKDGMIVIIDVSRKGAVVHRLRGHDGEIQALSWCPQLCDGRILGRSENAAEADWQNGDVLKEESERFCALASGSRDQTIRIWNCTNGKGVVTLKLPQMKRRGAADVGIKERIWLAVHWPRDRPTQLVSSSFGGELLLWDLVKGGRQRWSVLGQSSDGQNHSRIVFNLSSVSGEDGRSLLLSTSMDRDVKCWDLATLECCWTLPTLGGFAYSLAFSPVNSGSLAVGVGDGMIRVWDTISLQGPYDIKTLWQAIKSKVTSLCWHPTKESVLAFGTDDGKVGINEIYSNKPPQISSSYHRKTVYALAWGPPLPPVAPAGTGDGPALTLYSCAGEGIILQHNPWRLNAEAQDINRLIRETNAIKHKLPGRSELSWKPDGKVLAIGNDDGSIEVYQAPLLRLLCTVETHHKLINAIRWHHPHSLDPELSSLIASASNNATIYVHNLRTVLENPSGTPATMTEPYRTLSGHTAKVTSLAWSPHHDARLVSASYDSTAQVWDVLKEEPVCNYRGHAGRLLGVQWSPVDADCIWTGGDDFTVRQWEVSKQEHTRPPAGKKYSDLERKKLSGLKSKSKKGKKRSEVWPVGQDEKETVDPSPPTPVDARVREEERECRGEEQSVSSGASSQAPLEEVGSRENMEHALPNGTQLPASLGLQGRKDRPKERKREKPEAMGKRKKGPSLLPLSAANDHRCKEDLQEDCVHLARIRHQQGCEGEAATGSGDRVQLGLFVDRPTLHRMLDEEAKNHAEAGHTDLGYQLLLWKGDVKGALETAIERVELNDTLVAMAPMAGYAVWVRAVEAFVKQLCFQEHYVKAATLLLSVHRVYEAVRLLQSHQLFREAIALAKARLQPDDPVLRELYTGWASLMEKDGHYTLAAKCYLAMDSPFDAAKVLARKGDVASLGAAAEVAAVSGEGALASQLRSRCALDLVAQRDWPGAQEVVGASETLLGLRLVLCTLELLCRQLDRRGAVTWRSVSVPRYHGWSGPGEGSERPAVSLLDAVLAAWRDGFGVTMIDQERLQQARRQLSATEHAESTANTPPRLLLLHLSHEVSVSLVCALVSAYGDSVTALLHVLVRCLRAGNFTLMQDMGNMLLPTGPEFIPDLEAKMTSDPLGLAALQSLRAFLCYSQLYELWWKQGAERSRTSAEEGKDECQGDKEGGGGPSLGISALEPLAEARSCLAGSDCLLSVEHAKLQALDRRAAEIQRAVAALVNVHQRQVAHGPALGTGPGGGPEAEVKPEPELESEAGVRSASPTRPEPVVRPEAKPGVGLDPEMVREAGVITGPVVRPKLETEPEVGHDLGARPELKIVLEVSPTSTDPRVGSDLAQTDPEMQCEMGPEPEPTVRPKTGPDLGARHNPELESEARVRPECETRPGATVRPEPVIEPKVSPENETRPEQEMESGAGVRPETEPGDGHETGAEPDPEARTDAEKAPEAGPTTRLELEAEVRPEPTLENGSKDTSEETASSRQCEGDLTLCAEGPGSMVSLTQELQRVYRERETIAEIVKRHPFPDVSECCLLILSLHSLSPSLLPPDLPSRSLSLLRDHGSDRERHSAIRISRPDTV